MTNRILDFDGLMRMANGFQVSKILLVANDLQIFTHLSQNPMSASDLARRTGANVRAMEILANALVSLDLLSKEGERYSNSPAAEEMLVKGKDNYKGDMLEHIHHGWPAWSDLENTMKRGSPNIQEEDEFLIRNEARTRAFIKGMFQIGGEIAQFLCDKLDLSSYKNMLDLGGGPGTYSIYFTQRFPALKAMLFDLPQTIEIANEYLTKFNAQDRVKTMVGDFYSTDFGSGYDLVLISQILHSQTVEQGKALFKKAYAAMISGGFLIVQDLFMNEERTLPPNAAVFSVHMLAVTKGGRTYSAGEVTNWLAEAGFTGIEHKEGSARTSLLLARKTL